MRATLRDNVLALRAAHRAAVQSFQDGRGVDPIAELDFFASVIAAFETIDDTLELSGDEPEEDNGNG